MIPALVPDFLAMVNREMLQYKTVPLAAVPIPSALPAYAGRLSDGCIDPSQQTQCNLVPSAGAHNIAMN